MDGDQRDRPRPHRRTEPLDDARALQPERPSRLDLRPHQLARLGSQARFRRQQKLRPRPLFDRNEAHALAHLGHDPQRPVGRGGEPADHPRLVRAGSGLLQPRQHPFPGSVGGAAALFGGDVDQRRRAIGPAERARHRFSVRIDAGDLDDADTRQGAGVLIAAAASPADLPGCFQLLEHASQLDLLLGVELEGAGDLPFADARLAAADELQDLLAARKRRGRGPSVGRHG